MSKGKNQWVVPIDGGWGVRGEGNDRLTKVCKTQNEAIAVAKQIAKKSTIRVDRSRCKR